METTIDYSKQYPELSKEGQEKTQVIIDKFSKQLSDMMNETVSEFTKNIAMEIVNDDTWVDIRQQTLNALCGYDNEQRHNKADGTYLGQWWTKIRAKILEENREAIVTDILLDKEAKIKSLEETINYLKQQASNRY